MVGRKCEVTLRSIQVKLNVLLLLSFLDDLWGGSWQRRNLSFEGRHALYSLRGVRDRVSCCPNESQTWYVAKDDHKLLTSRLSPRVLGLQVFTTTFHDGW